MQSTDIDWLEARRVIHALVRARMHGVPAEDIEDITQIALADALKFMRRTPVDNFKGLLATIADRRIKDHWRRKRPQVELDEQMPDVSVPQTETLERSAFILSELFKTLGGGCLELFREHFAEQDWALVADRLGQKHAAIRKRWSRCLESARKKISQFPELSDCMSEILERG